MTTKFNQLAATAVAVLIGALIGFGCSQSAKQGDGKAKAVEPPAAAADTPKPKNVKRFGSVIGLRKDKKAYYNKLHAEPWPEINAMIRKCNIRNYSIYECEIDGKLYLFSYFEYTGDDFAADMQKMKDDPKTNEWWKETDPCQIRLPGTPDGQQWLGIEEVYHLD